MKPKKLVVFFDSGDTIIDEATQVFDENGIVTKAGVIPGADAAVRTLSDMGYTLALVADGDARSFKNVMTQNGIYDCFSALIYSENIRVCKPSSRMFRAAAGALDLGEKDFDRIVMVGNNLSRDIKGANDLGITSIFLDWTPRYPKTPSDDSEIPDYIIHNPLELIELVEKLNDGLPD